MKILRVSIRCSNCLDVVVVLIEYVHGFSDVVINLNSEALPYFYSRCRQCQQREIKQLIISISSEPSKEKS